MRYIDQVLPSLGENDVVLATIDTLYPGVRATASESPLSAQIKGRHAMAEALERARAHPPRRPTPEHADPLPTNVARRAFARAHITELALQAVREAGNQRSLAP